MSIETEAKQKRYGDIAREADAWGRIIGVRRLRPSEKQKVIGYTSDLEGSSRETVEIDKELEDGTVAKVKEIVEAPYRTQLIIAAAVCEIDNLRVPFARSRGELDAILDRLDEEGMQAAVKAIVRLGQDRPVTTEDDAKNLSGTPSSALSSGW